MKLQKRLVFGVAVLTGLATAQFGGDDSDMDYASMFAAPSADVLAQLIALSQANSSGGKKKKKNKKQRATTAAPTTEEATTTTSTTAAPTTQGPVNECALNMDDCSPNASCSDLEDGYSCTCNAGFSGDGKFCQDVDECASSPCDANASCQNSSGSYSCTCNAGFFGDGATCDDINECSNGRNNCNANASCNNVPGSFECSCNAGYEGNGIRCNDVNECKRGTSECDENASCSNTDGGYTCSCNTEYEGDGKTCNRIDHCAVGDHKCDADASCVSTVGGFERGRKRGPDDLGYLCQCNDGFEGNGFQCTAITTTTTTTTTTDSSNVELEAGASDDVFGSAGSSGLNAFEGMDMSAFDNYYNYDSAGVDADAGKADSADFDFGAGFDFAAVETTAEQF
ncbi:unnamed protein product [Oikopleura dioica]|uniref:EGF-like domain-containing protein n=1 Tax=Oikopleura dioica TaxID=34765 RepID=E4X5W9_OIKDI|nr:unnamed protein product [Oikopleura dioica]